MQSFVNATSICKDLTKWGGLLRTKMIKANLEEKHQMRGIRVVQGETWVHPELAVYLKEWVGKRKGMREKHIQVQLAKELGGQMEVETPVGYIDILTPTKIIEVKEISKWKHALGQILSYATYYPNREKCIYLFG